MFTIVSRYFQYFECADITNPIWIICYAIYGKIPLILSYTPQKKKHIADIDDTWRCCVRLVITQIENKMFYSSNYTLLCHVCIPDRKVTNLRNKHWPIVYSKHSNIDIISEQNNFMFELFIFWTVKIIFMCKLAHVLH